MEESNCFLDLVFFFLLAGERVRGFDMSFFVFRRTRKTRNMSFPPCRRKKTKKKG